MNCLPILVLVILSLIAIVSFLSLEGDFRQSFRKTVSSEEMIEKFTAEEEEGVTNGGKTESSDLEEKTIPLNISSLSSETGTNLIRNGSFQGENHASRSTSSSGNTIVTIPNPGKSDHVLKQSGSHNTEYKITTSVEAGKYYKLSGWVRDPNFSTNQSNKNIFTLLFHITNKTNDVTLTPKAYTLQSKTINQNVWYHQVIIFQATSKTNGSLDVILKTNSSGARYITGLYMEKYHPLLYGFPRCHDLSFFLSSSIKSGFDTKSNTLWLDISYSGKNFLFSKAISYTGGPVPLADNLMIGPPCSELGFSVNKFTLGWYGKFKHKIGKQVFIKMFTSAESGSILEISYVSDHPNYTSLEVTFLGKKQSWDIGLLDNSALYQLGYSNDIFTLFKDGLLLNSSSKSGEIPPPGETSEPSTPSLQEEKYEYFTDSKDEGHNSLYFINKPMLINPNKNIDGSLNNFFAFPVTLTYEESEKVNKYFQCAPCEKVDIPKPEPHFPIPPVEEEEIHDIIDEDDIIDEEIEKCQELCLDIKDREKEKREEREKEEDCAVYCDGHHVRDESTCESQEVVRRIVDSLNESNDEPIDPCTKITYHIKPDGKVVKNTYQIPDCDRCVTDTDALDECDVPGYEPTPTPIGNICPSGYTNC